MIKIALISKNKNIIEYLKKKNYNFKLYENLEEFLNKKESFDIVLYEDNSSENIIKIYQEIRDVSMTTLFLVLFHKFDFEMIKNGLKEGIFDFININKLESFPKILEKAEEYVKILKSKSKIFKYSKHIIIIKIPSDVKLINDTVLQIISTAHSAGFISSKNEENDLRLALTEGIVNAVVHGNKENKKKSVVIRVYIDYEKIKVKIRDEGKGFELDNKTFEIGNENLLETHGRGIYLMKITMDRVYYDRDRKELVLIKYKKREENMG